MAHVLIWHIYNRRNRRRIPVDMFDLRRERRLLRDAMNPFELPEDQFVKTFRFVVKCTEEQECTKLRCQVKFICSPLPSTTHLNKEAVRAFIAEIRPNMRERTRRTFVPPEIKIFCALYFFANGSYQRVIGQSFLNPLSQTMVSNSIVEVTNASIRAVNNWIWFPRDMEEKQRIKERFRRQFNMPHILGAVDGTHVAIVKPPSQIQGRRNRVYREEDYINRKGYHSMNCQIICDSRMRIMSLNASFPGRSHDSYVWNNSQIAQVVRANHENGDEAFILGDSGYPQQPWLLTPVANPVPGSSEEQYNTAHIQARCTVERCIGLLKGRFRCLLKYRTLHYEPPRAAKIILTCAMLHNIALYYNSNIDRLRYDEIDQQPEERVIGAEQLQRIVGQRVRQQYIDDYFHV